MSVKSSISLTEQQDAFARALVQNGQYSSLSAVVQQGLELLRQRTEAEAAEREALKVLLGRRVEGRFISSDEMGGQIEAMIKRKVLDVAD
ncbi:ribbon-helix-helix domain-containing protein [Roseibium aggregatum]|uniref:Type II toxin-antitoxin system ParD family antitoxin n=1 Tax=Roseibium aggregatum TaxID=187304 RepID=A0A926NYX1_9HYPH|nr:type II toxin-antitoxin system ParD family antitoxin [Roseibium aggregatum]MBD1548914.1 type II toxin-antitoxin system ParD family antitoxin [Roseibium aggregatum]